MLALEPPALSTPFAMNPRPGLTSFSPSNNLHTEPCAFVREVEERAKLEGLSLHVDQIDVWFRYYWEWRRQDGSLARDREEVLSCNADEVRLRACLQFCREMAWPIAYVPGRNIHLDIERVPLPAAAGPGFVPSSAPAGSAAPAGLPATEVANTGKPKRSEVDGPTVPASSLRHAGAYVPEHVRDFEPIQLAR